MKWRIWSAVGLLLGVVLPALAEDDPNAVQEKILIAFAKVHTVTVKIDYSRDWGPTAMHIIEHMTGNYACRIEDGLPLLRLESSWDSKQQRTEGVREEKYTRTIIDNRQGHYGLQAVEGKKGQAWKLKACPVLDHSPPRLIDRWRRDATVAVMPPVEVDGHQTYVLKVTPVPTQMQYHRLYYFRQDCGVLVRIDVIDVDGKQTEQTNYTDVKVDADVPLSTFDYTPDADLIDMTVAASQPSSQPTSRPTALERMRTTSRPAESTPASPTPPPTSRPSTPAAPAAP